MKKTTVTLALIFTTCTLSLMPSHAEGDDKQVTVCSLLEKMSESISRSNELMSTITDRFDRLEERLDGLESTVNEVKNNVDDLKNTVGSFSASEGSNAETDYDSDTLEKNLADEIEGRMQVRMLVTVCYPPTAPRNKSVTYKEGFAYVTNRYRANRWIEKGLAEKTGDVRYSHDLESYVVVS